MVHRLTGFALIRQRSQIRVLARPFAIKGLAANISADAVASFGSL